MSDFSELCPLFSTGVYNELYLGEMTLSAYTLDLYNFMGSAGDAATAPTSLGFGRTVVVTEVWAKRHGTVTAYTATLCIVVGRRTGSGTATVSAFGTLTLSVSSAVSGYAPQLRWIPIGPSSFTLNTADFLHIGALSNETDSAEQIEFIVQYREK